VRSFRDWIGIASKGFAMGAADLVPGVSGGTVAFITGIYDELISTIAGIGLQTLKDVFTEGVKVVWAKYNLSFLLVLGIGLFCAVALLAKSIHWLQMEYPTELRAFFFGLVLASAPILSREINTTRVRKYFQILLGVTIAVIITSLPPNVQSDSPLFLAIAGSIAICAMLLPGISGSFILLILGAYTPVISALSNLDFVRIGAFALGAGIGLLSFSRVLSRILKNHRSTAIAILTGFLLGSLHVLWPWKRPVKMLYTHSDGREEWLLGNIFPNFEPLSIIVIISFIGVGAIVVTALDRFSRT
jgi:putative membrane protein|tara:strand:+ start:350 stop:1255 length:906 start_codon:yes stop_codon:yes gene_type:complete